jgi:hypothetical protein
MSQEAISPRPTIQPATVWTEVGSPSPTWSPSPQPHLRSATPFRPQADCAQPALSPALRSVARSAAPESAPPPHCHNHNLKEWRAQSSPPLFLVHVPLDTAQRRRSHRMTSPIKALLFVLMASPSCLAQPGRPPAAAPISASPATGYTPVHQLDPTRDPAEDIRAAIAEAQRTRKRIILYLGGPWCPFCHQMDELFQKNPDLTQLRESHFITVCPHILTSSESRTSTCSKAMEPFSTRNTSSISAKTETTAPQN